MTGSKVTNFFSWNHTPSWMGHEASQNSDWHSKTHNPWLRRGLEPIVLELKLLTWCQDSLMLQKEFSMRQSERQQVSLRSWMLVRDTSGEASEKPEEQRGPQFYNQSKSRERRRPPSSLFLGWHHDLHHQVLWPHILYRTVMALFKSYIYKQKGGDRY